MCASEGLPFFKTGGLADVILALSKEYVKKGHNVSVVLPFYKHVDIRKKYKLKFGMD